VDDLLKRLEDLGWQGLTVSICYGPSSKDLGTCYSVDVLSKSGQMFDKPFAARTFEKCIEIAEIEFQKPRMASKCPQLQNVHALLGGLHELVNGGRCERHKRQEAARVRKPARIRGEQGLRVPVAARRARRT